MKYLKVYESNWWSKDPNNDELKEMADSYLAYLIDEGFETAVNLDYNGVVTTNTCLHIFRVEGFKWNNVKDQIIPFLSMLSKEYRFSELVLYGFYGNFTPKVFRKDGRYSSQSLSDLLSDKISPLEKMKQIKIHGIRRL